MAELIVTPNFAGADDVYERRVRLHEGLTEAESLKVWAKLVLANPIGHRMVIERAIAVARPDRAPPERVPFAFPGGGEGMSQPWLRAFERFWNAR